MREKIISLDLVSHHESPAYELVLWLAEHTANVVNEQFPAQGGYYTFQGFPTPPRPLASRVYLDMPGQFHSDNDEVPPADITELIRAKLETFQSGKMQLSFVFKELALEPYVKQIESGLRQFTHARIVSRKEEWRLPPDPSLPKATPGKTYVSFSSIRPGIFPEEESPSKLATASYTQGEKRKISESQSEIAGEVDDLPDGARAILPDKLKVSGRYGTHRDLTADDIRAIVARCRAFQEIGGKVTVFYEQLSITPSEPGYFELETLRGWLKDSKFRGD